MPRNDVASRAIPVGPSERGGGSSPDSQTEAAVLTSPANDSTGNQNARRYNELRAREIQIFKFLVNSSNAIAISNNSIRTGIAFVKN